MQKIIDKLKAFNELVMFKHSIFSLPFIFIAMIVSADGWFGFYLLFLGILAAISARNFAMSVNRYVDRDIDKKNPRTSNRPNVDGRIDGSDIMVFIIVNAFIFVFVSFLINSLAFYLSFLMLFILGIYSYFKRFSSLAHIVLGISLGLAPMAGAVAVEANIPLWSIMLSIGVIFWVAGFDLLYSLQDMEFDKENNLYSIPALYGAKIGLNVSLIFHIFSVVFWALFVWIAELGIYAFFAVIISAIVLFYEQKIVRDDSTKINHAFFTLNGYLGIIFLIFIILDKLI